ncbi:MULTISPECIES: TraR/DksA C4-type zinc finger protein [unclassified Pseudoalteromonas]|uniref:TraR/DksA family transcriptional regulator n=1 Tax=unclassified Pseudoalteromonas TaxID=194690 RepID=UPI0005AB61EC|nr:MULTISPECIES: TraR/DksA C4-type zinc finger protein [unclassified Pseudoalteromonas]
MESKKIGPKEQLEQRIIDAPEEEYMNEEQLAFFKKKLIELHDITREHIREAKEQMLSPPDITDLSDKATWEEQCGMLIRIVEREQRLLPKIQQALERIRIETYGYCLESGEPIGVRRLLARPTADFCADVKTMMENKEHMYQK